MIFRKLRGVNIPYRAQGLIWFTCVNFDRQPKHIKDRIRKICKEVGGEYEDALFVLLTRENVSIPWIEQNYYVGHSLLYAKRRCFFERYYRELQRLENRKGNDGNLPDLRGDLPKDR